MPTWTVKADRRKADVDSLKKELRLLEETVQGLTINLLDPSLFHRGPDAGGFRDFAPMATLTHDELAALEIVAEELLSRFGWLIDFQK